MVSTNTLSDGAHRRNTALILKEISATPNASSFEKTHTFKSNNAFFIKSSLLLLLFLTMSVFLNGIFAQNCNLQCITITVPLNGSTAPIPTQPFFTGTCNPAVAVTHSGTGDSFVTCADAGTTVTVNIVGGGSNCTGMVIVTDNAAPTFINCPSDVTVDCGDLTTKTALGDATATDNCTTSITPTSADVILSSSMAGVCDTIQRTWTATDAASNSSTCVQLISITDSNAPVLDFTSFSGGVAPVDVTVTCSGLAPAAMNASATDDCKASPFTVAPVDNITGQGTDMNMCNFYNYTMTRTWTASDDCGNMDVYTQTITVNDNVAPVIPAQTSAMVVNPSGANCQATVTLAIAPTDNCAAAANLQGFYEVTLQSNGMMVKNGGGFDASGTYDAGLYDVKFTAIDPCGNIDTEIYVLEVKDQGNPTAACLGGPIPITVDSDTGVTIIDPSRVDNGSSDLCTPQNMLTLSVAPATIECSDLMAAAPYYTDVPVTLTVTDANGNMNSCPTTVRVTPSPPTTICTDISVDLDANGDVSIAQGTLKYDTLVSAFRDSCHDEIFGTALTFSPSPIVFDCDDLGANTVTVMATNDFGLTSSCDATITVNDVTAPDVTQCRTTRRRVFLDDFGQVEIQPGWLIRGAQQIYMSSSADGSGSSGITDFRFRPDQDVTFTFDWSFETDDTTATDDKFRYKIGSNFWINLQTGAVLTGSGTVAVTVLAGELFIFRLDSDNDTLGSKLEISNIMGTGVSAGLSLTNDGDLYADNWSEILVQSDGRAFTAGRRIENLDACTNEFDIQLSVSPLLMVCDSIRPPDRNVTLTMTDNSGNTSSCVVPVRVLDRRPPSFECQDYTAQLDENGNVTVEPGWLMVGPQNLYVEGSSYTPTNGITFNSGGVTEYQVDIKATSTVGINWDYTSRDTADHEKFGYYLNGVWSQLSSPSLTSQSRSSNISVTQGDELSFAILSDNRDTAVAFVYITGINFINDFDPVLWERSAPTNSNGSAFIAGAVTDNCTGRVIIDNLSGWNLDCSDVGTTATLTVMISDEQNNSTSCTSDVTVVDNQAPIAICPSSYTVSLPASGTLDLSTLNPTTNITANSSDNCPGTLTVIANPVNLTCSDIGANTINYTVTDAGGNSASCTNVVTLLETTAPSIVCPADNLNVLCENIATDTTVVAAGMATASDNCSATTISYVSVIVTGTGGACYDIVRTWTAEDGSKNVVTCDQRFSIIDVTNPTITAAAAQADMTVVCESDIPARVNPVFDDNCDVRLDYDTTDSRINYPAGTWKTTHAPGTVNHYNFTIDRNWEAIDSCGNSSGVTTQTITVSDTDAPAIAATTATSLVVNTDAGRCDANVSLMMIAADITDCVPFQYLIITNNATVGDGMADASGIYPLGTTTVTFTTSDLGNGTTINSTTHTVTVEVKDVVSPTMVCVQNNVVQVDLASDGIGRLSYASIDFGSNDNCSGLTFTLDRDQFTCADLGTQTVVLTAEDQAGNKASCTRTITIDQGSFAGANALTISCPANASVTCPASPDPSATGTAIFTSGCTPGTLTYSDNPSVTPNCGTIVRTWTVTDGVGSQSCSHTITMTDANAPTFTTTVTPTTLNVDCDNVPAAANLQAMDDCKGNFAVTPTDVSTQGTDATQASFYNYTITRTWLADDDCGNTVSQVQTINVTDTDAPTVVFPNPLVISTGKSSCDTFLNINLALTSYIADNCAANGNLIYTVNGAANNSMISGSHDPANSPYTYNVTVDDPSGNGPTAATLMIEIADMEDPSAVCAQNRVINLGGASTATIDPMDFALASMDNCTAPGNLTFSANQTVFTSADIGAVAITITVTDEAGNTKNCVSNATVVDGMVFTAPQVAIAVGGSENGSITATGVQDVTSFVFNIMIDDATKAIADATGIANIHADLTSKGTFSSTVNGNGFSVAWTATNPTTDPLTLADGTALFDLQISATGVDGNTAALEITNNAVQKLIGGVATAANSSVANGSVSIFSPTSIFTFSGTVKTEEGSPVAGVKVDQTGAVTATSTTVADGIYSFTATSGSAATFTPTKSTADWKEGVTINDVFLILQHPTPAIFASGYKNIAADVDGSNVITGNDAILAFQLALNPAYTSVPGMDPWRFVHTSPDLSTYGNPFVPTPIFSESYTANPVAANETVDFVGMKIGDVDASADPLLRQATTSQYSGRPFDFLIKNQSIKTAGTRIEVPFMARDFNGVNGYQYTIEFEGKLLEFKEVIPGALPNLSSANFLDAEAADGRINAGWVNFDAIDLQDGETVFTLVFETKGTDFELQNVLSATDELIPMEVIKDGGLLGEVNLVFENTSSTTNVAGADFSLRQNVPNPFGNQTLIGFTLPESSLVQINFMDASGKLLHSIEGDFTQGYNEVQVRKEALPVTGVVFYQLQSAAGTLIKKMIILE